MNFRKNILLSFRILAVAVLVPAWAAKPVEFASSKAFSSEALFGKLDSIGKGATWMEWDTDGILDPEIQALVADKKGNIRADVEHGWYLNVPGNSKFAVLRKKSAGESLTFYDVAKFTTKKVPLEISEPLDPKKVFRDYRETIRGHFVHLDDTNLQVTVRDNEIQFSYLKPDNQALSTVYHFTSLPEHQKQAEIQSRRAFYAYEYSLMIQAFIASTRGLFNWQIWHWYNSDWTEQSQISDREIASILASPDQGKFVRVFFDKLADGDTVEMLSNAHGSFILTIRRR